MSQGGVYKIVGMECVWFASLNTYKLTVHT